MKKTSKRSFFPWRTRATGSFPAFNMDDLLGRKSISFQEPALFTTLHSQVILVTGAAGSIGSELCRQLLRCTPELVIALDTNETGLFELAESIHEQHDATRLRILIGDITDNAGMERLFVKEQPKIVFHAAAYKHVPLLEEFPDQAIRTNILAMYQLCCLAREYAVERFVFISTDKAAEPVSVMGASKRVGEMIVQALSRAEEGITCFCAVRFGNVIGSRGSVVPIFARQIEQGGPVTVTDPCATRYFMTIPEACGLVILTAVTAEKGGLYLLDMGKAVSIMDLALRMIHLRNLRPERDIPIVCTGLRPGERLHETLIATDEELAPTEYEKIFSVICRERAPMLTIIMQWMHILEQSLHRENNEQLREILFTLVCNDAEQALKAADYAS